MRRPAEALPGVERIAVLRANGIGDLMFALPALASLRAAYPAAKITLLAGPAHRELFAARPAPFDELVVVPVSGGVREEPGVNEDPQELEGFFADMRMRNFDLVLQMHGGGRNSNPFAKRLGGRVTAGTRTPDAETVDIELPYVYYQSEVLRCLELVELVGGPPVEVAPRLEVTEADCEQANGVLPPGPRPLAVLNPGAGDPRRRWPTDKFARVGDVLSDTGATVAVVGAATDSELTSAVVGSMERPAHDLAGTLKLGGLAGLLSRADVMVTNDSGPLHVGAAAGAPTVAIFWCGNQINAGLPFRSWHRPVLSWRLDCPVCGLDCTRESCPHQESFVADVPIEDVAAPALELLSASVRARRDRPTPSGW